MKIFGREPSLWIATIGTVLSLIAGFGLDWLTPEQAALVVVVLNALLGVVNAVLDQLYGGGKLIGPAVIELRALLRGGR